MKPVDILPFSATCCDEDEHIWQPVTNYDIVTEFLICDRCGALATDADMLDDQGEVPAQEVCK